MAILITHLNAAGSLENVTTHAIASFTLPANRLGIIFVMNQGSVGPTTPTIPNWTQHTTFAITDTRRVTMFTRVVATDTTEALTVSFGGTSQNFITHSNQYCDDQCVITGTAGADGIVQALGSGNIHNPALNDTPTLTALNAFAHVNNASLSYINIGFDSNSRAVGTGFTALSNVQADTSTASITQWKNTNDTVHELNSCAGSVDMFIGMAVQLNHVNFQGKAARLLM